MRKGTWTTIVLVIAGMALLPALTLAKTPIKESAPADPRGSVEIENLIGTVKVTGWNKDEVSVTGTLGEGAEELDFEIDGDETYIRVIWPDLDGEFNIKGKDAGTDLEISVPRGSDVYVEGVNTMVNVSNVEGDISIELVNGDVEVDGSPSEVEVEVINGDVSVSTSSDQVSVEAVNGTITLTGGRGDVSAATVNGMIVVSGTEFDDADFETVSGSIEFNGSLSMSGDFQFETHSGEIILVLPSDVSAEFDVETFSGKITNEFGKQASRVNKYGPGYNLYFSTGSGDADVSIQSFSGKVIIKKN